MDRDFARQIISDITYRQRNSPTFTNDVTEGTTLANYLAMAATHVSRRAVDNRWCAPAQRTAFLAHFAHVLPQCREIARLAITGAPQTAIAQYAALYEDALRCAPGARSLTTAAL